MARKFLLVGTALLTATCAGARAYAAPGADPAPAASAPAADPFAQAIAAQAVASFARRQQDPQAMIVAARMLQEVPFHDAAATQARVAPAFSPQGLYDEAKVLAKGDPMLLAQIRVGESSGSRGVLSSAFGTGLLRLVREVAARGTYRFDVDAVGGQILRVGAIGDIGTNMLLRLVDGAGHILCQDDSGSYAPVCAMTPRATGRFAVEIANRSAKASSTVILSN
jgi:hypothetical protein